MVGAGSSQASPTILMERTADAQFASGDVACSAPRRGVDAPPTGGVGRVRWASDGKSKNPAAPAVKREAEEDWGKERWR